MQCTEAGLAISVAGLVAVSDGLQPLAARAMMQRVAICGRCMSINRHVFFFKILLILLCRFIDGR